MTLLAPVLLAIVTYLLMRRRGRVFLEQEEALALGYYTLLAIAQRIWAGHVSYDDFIATPLMLAFPVVVGHARGASRGASAAMVGGWALCLMSIAFTLVPEGQVPSFPGQYVIAIALLGITAALAGARFVPKAIKPLLTVTYLLFVACFHPEFLHSLVPFVIQFSAVALASLGLVLNPFGARTVSTVHYPTSPSRRT